MSEALHRIGVLGASSFVGKPLLALLGNAAYQVSAFSRQYVPQEGSNIHWLKLPLSAPILLPDGRKEIPTWVCLAPVWVLPDYLPLMKSMGARRVVALSSTSRFTKSGSSDISEQTLAKRLAESEQELIDWSQENGIEWIILRPTLIYGLGMDKNICEIARFIRRFSFFPVFGKAAGLRQPVHVQDVAQACFAASQCTAANRAYNISGGEIIAYREMVVRVFMALGRTPRLLTVPLSAFRLAVALIRFLPRYRKWSPAMAERMNQDLVFDHIDAKNELGFTPRNFNLSASELPH